jgi:hypothetical protein
MLKEIPQSDIIVRPFKVYKEWRFDENDIPPVYGENASGSFIDLDTDAVTVNGLNKKVVYASIKSQFYLNSATASILTEVGRRISYASTNERNLENELVVLSIPQEFYGEGVKYNSVRVEDNQTSKVYTDDGYSNLLDSTGSICGNVFYDRGLVVLSKGIVSGSSMGSFFLDFRSTKTIYENEIFISVLENEFNVSQNPTAVYEVGGKVETFTVTNPYTNDGVSYNPLTRQIYIAGTKYIRTKQYPFTSSLNPTKFASFDDYFESGSLDPTGSYLAPYITTIGLYDDDLNLVAIAKLPQPIKSLPDYPLNFILRFDT